MRLWVENITENTDQSVEITEGIRVGREFSRPTSTSIFSDDQGHPPTAIRQSLVFQAPFDLRFLRPSHRDLRVVCSQDLTHAGVSRA